MSLMVIKVYRLNMQTNREDISHFKRYTALNAGMPTEQFVR